ncbi:hypothetical protein BH23BAC3_BH23BAC3_13040 [soil metagenome]
MNLLLDENLPVKLTSYFTVSHQVSTVVREGWSGVKNGKLIKLMSDRGFDVLITIDKNIGYQQKYETLAIKIVVQNAVDNKISTLEPYVKEAELLLSKETSEKLLVVDV